MVLDDEFKLGGRVLNSRLFLGTARYPSPDILKKCLTASASDVITVSLRREAAGKVGGGRFWNYLSETKAHILPNTAGCHSVKEAITTAHMARDLFKTSWIKLEVIGNDETLQPDIFGTLEAAKILSEEGFDVFPYTTDDLIVAERLLAAGCKIIMPWAAPIGTGQGPTDFSALRLLRARLPEATLIVDAGIGLPSHAAMVMEIGFDGVLLNTAVAKSVSPVHMAKAFKLGVEAGRCAYLAGPMKAREGAVASTPQVGIPFWHQRW
jgi:thiazole synthase